jgi:hypothetical protein
VVKPARVEVRIVMEGEAYDPYSLQPEYSGCT